MAIFASDNDREEYLRLLAEFGVRYGLTWWAWCFMANHVHFVVVPQQADSLARAIGEAHRRYTRYINFREGVRGHLFQERFHSFPIQDDRYLLAVVRYVECNPVRARLVKQAELYPWSSAKHHVTGKPDRLVRESPIREMAPDWGKLLHQEEEEQLDRIRRYVRTGRPCGNEEWIKTLEKQLGRTLLSRKSGWPKGRLRKGQTE